MQATLNNGLSRTQRAATRRTSRRTQRYLIRGLAWFIAMVIREVIS